jgi:hypothetical protein
MYTEITLSHIMTVHKNCPSHLVCSDNFWRRVASKIPAVVGGLSKNDPVLKRHAKTDIPDIQKQVIEFHKLIAVESQEYQDLLEALSFRDKERSGTIHKDFAKCFVEGYVDWKLNPPEWVSDEIGVRGELYQKIWNSILKERLAIPSTRDVMTACWEHLLRHRRNKDNFRNQSESVRPMRFKNRTGDEVEDDGYTCSSAFKECAHYGGGSSHVKLKKWMTDMMGVVGEILSGVGHSSKAVRIDQTYTMMFEGIARFMPNLEQYVQGFVTACRGHGMTARLLETWRIIARIVYAHDLEVDMADSLLILYMWMNVSTVDWDKIRGITTTNNDDGISRFSPSAVLEQGNTKIWDEMVSLVRKDHNNIRKLLGRTEIDEPLYDRLDDMVDQLGSVGGGVGERQTTKRTGHPEEKTEIGVVPPASPRKKKLKTVDCGDLCV